MFGINLGCINTAMALLSLLLQMAVIAYGLKMYFMIRPVRYWTASWMLYSIAHTLILFRRILGWLIREHFLPPAIPKETYELGTQIVISIVFLFSAHYLSQMYTKYFQNGIKVKSWKEEKAFIAKKAGKRSYKRRIK